MEKQREGRETDQREALSVTSCSFCMCVLRKYRRKFRTVAILVDWIIWFRSVSCDHCMQLPLWQQLVISKTLVAQFCCPVSSIKWSLARIWVYCLSVVLATHFFSLCLPWRNAYWRKGSLLGSGRSDSVMPNETFLNLKEHAQGTGKWQCGSREPREMHSELSWM